MVGETTFCMLLPCLEPLLSGVDFFVGVFDADKRLDVLFAGEVMVPSYCKQRKEIAFRASKTSLIKASLSRKTTTEVRVISGYLTINFYLLVYIRLLIKLYFSHYQE